MVLIAALFSCLWSQTPKKSVLNDRFFDEKRAEIKQLLHLMVHSLYSDREIFLRELVSNAVDATQKLRKMAALGQFTGELGDQTIDISFDKDKKTITVSDRGLGMTA